LPEPPTDIHPVESGVKGPKLCNSDIPCTLKQKLRHLPKNEQKAYCEFTSVFTDIPGKTNCGSHDVDVGDAQSI